jgi:hypothetical protein
MNILQHVIAPQPLLELIIAEYESISTIERVILVGGTDQLEGRLGEYVPETKAVIIDLKACMENQQWMQKGMAFVPNVWTNIVHTVFHESIHAEQYESLGEDMHQMPMEELERDADIRALEKSIDYFHDNPKTPDLKELGWVGEQLRALFNGVYAQAPDMVGQEMDLLGTEAGGFAVRAAAYLGDVKKAKTMIEMVASQAATGDFGLKVGSHYCFKTEDFLELTSNRDRR